MGKLSNFVHTKNIEENIVTILKIPFSDPEDPELYERKKLLIVEFKQFDSFNLNLYYERLKIRKKNDLLSALFYDKISDGTRKLLLGILKEKVHQSRGLNNRLSTTPVSKTTTTTQAAKPKPSEDTHYGKINTFTNLRYIDSLATDIAWQPVINEYYVSWVENKLRFEVNVPKEVRVDLKSSMPFLISFGDNNEVFPSKDSALKAVNRIKDESDKDPITRDPQTFLPFAFYFNKDKAVLPTVFSPDTTPNIYEGIEIIRNDPSYRQEWVDTNIILFKTIKALISKRVPPFLVDIAADDPPDPTDPTLRGSGSPITGKSHSKKGGDKGKKGATPKLGAFKEMAGKVHGMRRPKGQAIAVIEVRVGDKVRHAAAANSRAGFTPKQRARLRELNVEEIPSFGKELLHAEENIAAWVANLRNQGTKVQVLRWGVSATRTGDYICEGCLQIIKDLGGFIEKFSDIGKTY